MTGSITSASETQSRFNALKHGIHAETQIMFDETAGDLAELTAELHEQNSPANATERFLVDTLIHNEWRLRRTRHVDADLWQQAADAFLDQHAELEEATSGEAFATTAPAFERLQRIVNSCERNYHRTLKELHSLKTKDAAGVHHLPTPQPAARPEPAPQPNIPLRVPRNWLCFDKIRNTPLPQPPNRRPLRRLPARALRQPQRKPGQRLPTPFQLQWKQWMPLFWRFRSILNQTARQSLPKMFTLAAL